MVGSESGHSNGEDDNEKSEFDEESDLGRDSDSDLCCYAETHDGDDGFEYIWL